MIRVRGCENLEANDVLQLHQIVIRSMHHFGELRFGISAPAPNQKFLLLSLIAPVTVPIFRDTKR